MMTDNFITSQHDESTSRANSTTSSTSPTPTTTLPNELWLNSLSYLEPNDLLHSSGPVNRNFYAMSSSDVLWEKHCRRRWRGKQNVRRFFYKGGDDYRGKGGEGCEGSGSGNRDVNANSNGGNFTSNRNFWNDTNYCHGHNSNDSKNSNNTIIPTSYCTSLLQQFNRPENVPAINMNSLIHQPTSWKESYLMAEMDSKRKLLSREELTYFKWQLIYDGNPSRMGLRQFHRNGTYWSPYIGVCEWLLHGQHLMFAGMALLVERDEETWGWVIGRGERTVYYSVEIVRDAPAGDNVNVGNGSVEIVE
mmetsp:Transcript_7982/g.16635  ORF Transcript_7982/g.16635 Transcript_7982/m.16635 type:complete len:305 (-) Transcript_7982:12-926(-)